MIVFPPAGCFVSGLYLEGADWDIEKGCLVRSKPKDLMVQLPILKVIPIEAHHLKLQVWSTDTPISLYIDRVLSLTLFFSLFTSLFLFLTCFHVFCTTEYFADTSVHHIHAEECYGCGVGV